jgi:hypothetical protein
MRGVQRGSGPSSNVRAMRFPGCRPCDVSRRPFQTRIGPAFWSGPPLARGGVALRPVVRVDSPWTPRRIASGTTRNASRIARAVRRLAERLPLWRRFFSFLLLPGRRRRRHRCSRDGRRVGRSLSAHLAGRLGFDSGGLARWGSYAATGPSRCRRRGYRGRRSDLRRCRYCRLRSRSASVGRPCVTTLLLARNHGSVPRGSGGPPADRRGRGPHLESRRRRGCRSRGVRAGIALRAFRAGAERQRCAGQAAEAEHPDYEGNEPDAGEHDGQHGGIAQTARASIAAGHEYGPLRRCCHRSPHASRMPAPVAFNS